MVFSRRDVVHTANSCNFFFFLTKPGWSVCTLLRSSGLFQQVGNFSLCLGENMPSTLQFPCWFTWRYHVRNWSMYSSVLVKNQMSKQTINPNLSCGHLEWTGFIHSVFSSRWVFLCSWGLVMLGNTLEICKSHSCLVMFLFSTVVTQCPRSRHWLAGRKCPWPVFVAKGTLSAREVRALCLTDPISADFLAVKEFLSETMLCCLLPLCLCALMNAVFSSTHRKEVVVS